MNKSTNILIDVPQHYQSEGDYACGPMAIRMVADYYYRLHKNSEMTATEWLQVLGLTMNNDIWRKCGTKKENVVIALKKLNFNTNIICGKNFDDKLQSIHEALSRRRPVIIYCVIKPTKRPYGHFAVVVGMNRNAVYIRDPYPGNKNIKRPKKININIFKNIIPKAGQLVWGRVQWGVEIAK